MGKPTKKDRKASWLYEDLAWKIQTPTPTIKAVLALLAKQANDGGHSYPSYEYVMACSGIGSKTTLSTSLRFLRDELKVLTWRKGGVGYANPNRYTLNLSAMKRLVETQGIFDPETGRLIEVSPVAVLQVSPVAVLTQGGSESNGCTHSPDESESSLRESESSLPKSESSGCTGTLYKNNPLGIQPPKVSFCKETRGEFLESVSCGETPRPKTQLFSIKGVGLVEGTSYKDAEQKVKAQRDAYLEGKCI